MENHFFSILFLAGGIVADQWAVILYNMEQEPWVQRRHTLLLLKMLK